MSDNHENNDSLLHCSFCGKSQNEVKKLIAGRGVYICDECIEVCINIVADEMAEINKTEGISSTGPNQRLRSFWINMSSGRTMPKKFCRWPYTITISVLIRKNRDKMLRLPSPTLF